MALINTFDKFTLKQEFKKFDRDYFSQYGYQAILDIFAEMYGEESKQLDVIAICCEFTEASAEEIYNDYSNIDRIAATKDENGEIDEHELLNALNYYTYAVKLGNGDFLYSVF